MQDCEIPESHAVENSIALEVKRIVGIVLQAAMPKESLQHHEPSEE